MRFSFSVVALPEAPRRCKGVGGGPPSWKAPILTPGSFQAFTSEMTAYKHKTKTQWLLTGTKRCFFPAWQAGAGEAGALSSAEVGDELVFAWKGRERQLFLWVVKKRKTRG